MSPPSEPKAAAAVKSGDAREQIAARAARLLRPGAVVNLGIGIPTLVSKYLPGDAVFLHSENGVLGVGPPPPPDRVDPLLIDAGKRPITVQPGASYFDSATSFAMIRGGHIHAAVLGALQIDEQGRMANWAVPGEPVLGVGGAMDLLSGVREVIAVLLHTTREGSPKLVRSCTLPLSSIRPVTWVVTDLATFHVSDGSLHLTDLAPGVTLAQVQERTEARFRTPSA